MSSQALDARLASHLLDGGCASALETWCALARGRLDRDGVALFPISDLGLDEEESRRVAVAVVAGLLRSVERAGGPEGLRVEVDRTQPTYVPPGYASRTLLPHHDGGHCSYLTPSRHDWQGWDVETRRYSTEGRHRYSTHKLYAGIFVCHPGEALSITTYYPLVPILARGFRLRHGRDPGSISELASYLGHNLLRSLALRDQYGGHYPTLSGLLGCCRPLFNVIAPHTAEADFEPESHRQFPELEALARSCPCGRCVGPGARLFCHMMMATLALTWPDFRREFEFRVRTRRFDLLVWNNLSLLHGGVRGGPSRVLQPISIVADRAAGPSYETWLAQCWRRHPAAEVARSSAVEPTPGTTSGPAATAAVRRR